MTRLCALIALTLLLLLWSHTAFAQYQPEWSVDFPGWSFFSIGGHSVDIDSANNIYLGGHDSDGSEGNAHVVKFDASGTELWRTPMGGGYGAAVAVNSNGVYLTGQTDGDLAGTNKGYTDPWLAKFDTSGTELWRTQVGSDQIEMSNSVAVDSAGCAYMTGFTQGDLAGPYQGDNDAWIAKFDATGNREWWTQLGTSGDDGGTAIAVDATGGVYVTGHTNGNLAGTHHGTYDAWLAKFDVSGAELWRTQIGTTAEEFSESIAVDATGNVYLSGTTNGNFGGPSQGLYDAWLAKFDPSGTELWRTQFAFGPSSNDWSHSVAVDSAGVIYVTGDTNGPTDRDAWLATFDTSGTELWRTQFGHPDAGENAYSVAVDSASSVYSAGHTYQDGLIDSSWLTKFTPVPEPGLGVLLVTTLMAIARRR